MQANIHTPERLADETMVQYRDRRAQSKEHALKITLSGHHTPSKGTSRQDHRAALRQNGEMHKHASSYGRGLRNWINRKQAAALA